MGRIAEDFQRRLAGISVPVLLPEQMREPLEAAPTDTQGRPMVGGGERGLSAYLARHPEGYVQIEQPVPITSDGLVGTFWVAVAALAPDADAAKALAQQVRLALYGTPTQPDTIQEITPAQPELLQGGVWMIRPTFQTFTVDGTHVFKE